MDFRLGTLEAVLIRQAAVFSCVLVLLLGKSTWAKVYSDSLSEFVADSDCIVCGTVASVEQDVATLEVDEILHGSCRLGSITFRVFLPDACKGQPRRPAKGEYLVAFLRHDSGTWSVLEDGAGTYTLSPQRRVADLEGVKMLVKIPWLKDEDAVNRAMLAEMASSNALLRSEAHRHVMSKVAYSELRQNYKDDLVRLLAHEDSDVRRASLHAIRFVRAESAIPLMVKATQDEDLTVVAAASMALAQYDTPESSAGLIALTRHHSPDIRVRACIDLDDRRCPEAKDAVRRLMSDSEATVRAMAARGMVFWLRRHQADEVIPDLIALLDDSDPGVQSTAASMLGESRHFSAVQPLLELLRRPSLPEETEGRAIEALSVLRSEGDVRLRDVVDSGLDLIIEALHRGGWIASLNAVVILENVGSPKAVSALEQVETAHPIESIRSQASDALKRIGRP